MYVGDYNTNGQQQYYTTSNDAYSSSSSGNHQGNAYIVPVDEAILSGQSRESPQTISAVSTTILLLLIRPLIYILIENAGSNSFTNKNVIQINFTSTL